MQRPPFLSQLILGWFEHFVLNVFSWRGTAWRTGNNSSVYMRYMDTYMQDLIYIQWATICIVDNYIPKFSFVLLFVFSFICWEDFNRPLESLLSTLWHCCWLSFLWTLSKLGFFPVRLTELVVNWWVHDLFSWYLQRGSTIMIMRAYIVDNNTGSVMLQ